MKTRKHRSTRNSASIHRITRNTAVNERRRRLSLWQFYQAKQEDAPQQMMASPLTEPSAR